MRGSSMNSKFMRGGDSFSWKKNAIQQVGLALAKRFRSATESFERTPKSYNIS